MPICKNCKKQFPNRIVVEEKEFLVHHRTYCIECNPIGERNFWGGKRANKSQYVNGKRKLRTREFVCKTCGKAKRYKTRGLECSSCQSKRIRNDRKDKAVEYLGGRCKVCGYNRCRQALVFHHNDASKKDFVLSWNWEKAWNIIKKELDKCSLLCNRCHTEVHAGLYDID